MNSQSNPIFQPAPDAHDSCGQHDVTDAGTTEVIKLRPQLKKFIY